jgi:ArsR family metal-binding transcriptional regulator
VVALAPTVYLESAEQQVKSRTDFLIVGFVVVAFDGSGMFSTTTYGVTREACREIKKLGDAISEALESGDLPEPDYKP